MAIFFTSDLHLGHNKEFVYGARGFSSMEEHDQTLVTNWNETVSPLDTVYVLGDIFLYNVEYGAEMLGRLNGRLHIIRGNHDTDAKLPVYLASPNVESVEAAAYLRAEKVTFYLSHYPTVVSHEKLKALRNAVVNLYGHTHQTDNFYCLDGKAHPYMYHVGLSSHAMRPVSLEQVLEDIRHQRSMWRDDETAEDA